MSAIRCAPERSTTTPRRRRLERRRAASFERHQKTTSAPLAAASSFVTSAGSAPFRARRGSSAAAGWPACESEPSATGSSSGMVEHAGRASPGRCSRRSRGSRRLVHDCVLCTTVRSMQERVISTSCSRTAPSSRASPSGADGVAAGEACFTTAMTGYEEAVTDPSYVAQVLCFAYPLIGTYGVDEARMESERVQCEGVVMRDARPEFAALAARARRRRAHRASTRARSSARSATAACCAARSATRRSRSCASARSPSRSSTATRCRASPARPSRTRSARGRASSSSTSARSTRSRAGSPTTGVEALRRPGDVGRRRDPRGRPARRC